MIYIGTQEGKEGSMAFEKFIIQTKKNFPTASISTLGRLSLNEAAISAFGLQTKNFAELFYDSEKALIGIKFLNAATENSLKVQRRDNSGVFLSVKSFFKAYQIDYSTTYFCEVSQDEKDKDFLIINLNTKTERR